MAESETLDHFSGPLVRKKKRRRDRLMAVAEASPEWAIGFEDECWWSRLALPRLSKVNQCVSSSSRSLKTIPSPKPSPATGSLCLSTVLSSCIDVSGVIRAHSYTGG